MATSTTWLMKQDAERICASMRDIKLYNNCTTKSFHTTAKLTLSLEKKNSSGGYPILVNFGDCVCFETQW